MAHGMTNPVYNYICKEDVRLIVWKEDNTMVEHYFPAGEKVDLTGTYGFYADHSPEFGYWHKFSQAQIESVDDDKLFYELNEDYYGDYLYVNKASVDKFFRPIIHGHLATKLFDCTEQLNEFLKDMEIDCLKDIKMNNSNYLVIYIDMEDD